LPYRPLRFVYPALFTQIEQGAVRRGLSITWLWASRTTELEAGATQADLDTIVTMNITNGTVSADVEYTNHEDGTWSFKLTIEDDPVSVESAGSFPSKELAEEQVNYELQAASLRIAEG